MDCEFIEDGRTIDLLSIGIVAEDGREYYGQSVEFDHRTASEWVKEHVLPHLQPCMWAHVTHVDSRRFYENELNYHQGHGQCIDQTRGLVHTCPWRTRKQIQRDILSFMDIEQYGKPELWGFYSAYDHVVFCQLFGRMIDLPKGFPMYTRDLKQWCDALGNPWLPKQEVSEHHALADAKWNQLMWQMLHEMESKEGTGMDNE